MNARLRFLLLGASVSAGIGSAIALGTRDLPAADAEQPATVLVASMPPAGPVVAPIHPPVAQQAPAPSDANVAPLLEAVKTLSGALAKQNEPAKIPSQPAPTRANAFAGQGEDNLPPPAKTKPAPPKPAPAKDVITKSPGAGDDNLIINAQGEDLLTVLDLLAEQGGLNILASKNVSGKVNASFKNVSVENALTAILKQMGYVWRRDGRFIHVGTPDDFKQLERNADRIGTRLYRPNYVPARELELLITPLLTETIGKVKATAPAEKGIAADASAAGSDNYAGTEVVVVRDYEAVLNLVDELVANVDRRPTQVAIEAMILSVRLNDTNKFGVDFELLRNKAHVSLASGTPLPSLDQIDLTEGGLKFGYLDGSVSAFVEAIETIGEADIVATPRLMCINRQRAEILIGSQLGYVSTTQTETATTQSVEFLEVGTQLRLRPFIAADGQVRLEVHPELSTGQVRVEQNFTLPDKEVTQVTTNIMVRDGATVIIGGLIRDELTQSITQIPLLGSLPIVGPVFRRTTEENERRELLVLITPHVVYEPEMNERGDKAAREFHHRHGQYADKLNPLGKRYLARKYFHAAQEAWYAGDQKRALRMVNLAIHFDPMSRAPLELRSDIVDGRRRGDHTDVHPPRVGPGINPLDSDVLAPWIIDELQGQVPAHGQAIRHPVDGGRPGTVNELGPPKREETLREPIMPATGRRLEDYPPVRR